MFTAGFNSEHELWNEKKFRDNDLLIYTENSIEFIEKATRNIRNGALGFYRTIKFIILLPIRITLILLSFLAYLMFAPILRMSFIRLTKKFRAYRLELEAEIENKNLTRKQFKRKHASSKEILDEMLPRVHKLKGDFILKPAIVKLLDEVKLVEQATRVRAYPERNEIVLSYDELRELNELTDMSF